MPLLSWLSEPLRAHAHVSVPSSVDEHLGWFHSVAPVAGAAVNAAVAASLRPAGHISQMHTKERDSWLTWWLLYKGFEPQRLDVVFLESLFLKTGWCALLKESGFLLKAPCTLPVLQGHTLGLEAVGDNARQGRRPSGQPGGQGGVLWALAAPGHHVEGGPAWPPALVSVPCHRGQRQPGRPPSVPTA